MNKLEIKMNNYIFDIGIKNKQNKRKGKNRVAI